MKSIKNYLNFISFINIATTIVACSPEDDRTVKIVDFTKPQNFTFTVLNDSSRPDTNVIGVILFVKGEIEGEVIIGADGAGGGRLTGKIDTSFRNNGDWFVNRSRMEVKPIGYVKGELTITFRFLKI